jgi:N-acetylglutamate synthase and related acetyltransferases
MLALGQPIWVALDDAGRVVGGAVCQWTPRLRVMLLAWLAVRPGARGGGVGGRLLDAALASWRTEYAPCLVLAEVEDPEHHRGSDLTGDPARRHRFYLDRGARILDLPYFQPSLGRGLPRVPHLHLMVLHVDPALRGRAPDTVDAATVRRYLQWHQRSCEGRVGTDEQSTRLWHAIDAHLDGVPYRSSLPSP